MAPQYTMQQITKEYKKRQKFSEDIDPIKQYQDMMKEFNPFDSRLPVITQIFSEGLVEKNLPIKINDEEFSIPPFGQVKIENCTVMNTCGKTNCVAFSFSDPAYLCVSISPTEISYGNIYEGDGIIQLWEVSSVPQYKSSVIHHGYTVLSMKFFPCKSSKGIGTLVACLANGDVCVYNFPFYPIEVASFSIQPIHLYRIPGLVFSSVVWTNKRNLALGSQDGSIFYLTPGCEPYIKIFNGHRLPITSITWCGHSKLVVTTGLDGYLKVWDQKGVLLDSLCLSKRWCYHVTNNPLGKYIFYDNDATVSPHKIVRLDQGKLESKKQLSHSTEATISSCFSPISNFDYIVTSEGFIESIYVSELEKNSKKRKTPWDRYNKILFQRAGEIFTGEKIPKNINCPGKGMVRRIDLLVVSDTLEKVAWAGETCGIYESRFEDFS